MRDALTFSTEAEADAAVRALHAYGIVAAAKFYSTILGCWLVPVN